MVFLFIPFDPAGAEVRDYATPHIAAAHFKRWALGKTSSRAHLLMRVGLHSWKTKLVAAVTDGEFRKEEEFDGAH